MKKRDTNMHAMQHWPTKALSGGARPAGGSGAHTALTGHSRRDVAHGGRYYRMTAQQPSSRVNDDSLSRLTSTGNSFNTRENPSCAGQRTLRDHSQDGQRHCTYDTHTSDNPKSVRHTYRSARTVCFSRPPPPPSSRMVRPGGWSAAAEEARLH